MQGWKTYTAGAILILTGLAAVFTGAAGLIAHYANPASSAALDPDVAIGMIQGGVTTIGLGLGLIGVGHKIDKLTAETAKP